MEVRSTGGRPRGRTKASVVASTWFRPERFEELDREVARQGTNLSAFIRGAVEAELDRLAGRWAKRKRKGDGR